jgi:hypothetical protein
MYEVIHEVYEVIVDVRAGDSCSREGNVEFAWMRSRPVIAHPESMKARWQADDTERLTVFASRTGARRSDTTDAARRMPAEVMHQGSKVS